jgi:hypothetical protein
MGHTQANNNVDVGPYPRAFNEFIVGLEGPSPSAYGISRNALSHVVLTLQLPLHNPLLVFPDSTDGPLADVSDRAGPLTRASCLLFRAQLLMWDAQFADG